MAAEPASGPVRQVVGHLRTAPPLEMAGDTATIDCRSIYYRYVNEAVRAAFERGARTVKLMNVMGQRYIGTGIQGADKRIEVHGTPGQDAAMFMDGPALEVFGNAQDGLGNTMSAGQIVVHGSAGDVLGYGMRGGRVFVAGDVGYRVGIHMKAREELRPIVVCGGKARDFFGEYMAGGLLVLLGLDSAFEGPLAGGYLGTGMHGGEIYLRGEIEPWRCGGDVTSAPAGDDEMSALAPVLTDFCAAVGRDATEVLSARFTRIAPASSRPYNGRYVGL
jgi:glutamate synthase domain-containing protein 3